MIPADAALLAPVGHLLVERLEQPLMFGLIHRPPASVVSTRSTEAVVVSVGEGVRGSYKPGEAVFLSTNVGRAISLGIRGEKKLHRITPHMILARITGEIEGIESRGESGKAVEAWEVEEAMQIDEGSREALR